MAAIFDRFAVLSDFDSFSGEVDLSDLPIQSPFKKVMKKSKPKKESQSTDTLGSLKDQLNQIKERNRLCLICYHYGDGDKFLVCNLDFSSKFLAELSVRGIKKVSVSDIEKILNEEKNKDLKKLTIWPTYFEDVSLKKLTDHEYFEVPPEFKSTFDLVRGNPISSLKYHNVMVFDFRDTNSKQEFVYLPDGSRVYFGVNFDNYRVSRNRVVMKGLLQYYLKSLDFIDMKKIADAYDRIADFINKYESFTDLMKAIKTYDEAFDMLDNFNEFEDLFKFLDEIDHHINGYTRYRCSKQEDETDEQFELRSLRKMLQFNNLDGLKSARDDALTHQKILFKLDKFLSKVAKHQQLSRDLEDVEQYPPPEVNS